MEKTVAKQIEMMYNTYVNKKGGVILKKLMDGLKIAVDLNTGAYYIVEPDKNGNISRAFRYIMKGKKGSIFEKSFIKEKSLNLEKYTQDGNTKNFDLGLIDALKQFDKEYGTQYKKEYIEIIRRDDYFCKDEKQMDERRKSRYERGRMEISYYIPKSSESKVLSKREKKQLKKTAEMQNEQYGIDLYDAGLEEINNGIINLFEMKKKKLQVKSNRTINEAQNVERKELPFEMKRVEEKDSEGIIEEISKTKRTIKRPQVKKLGKSFAYIAATVGISISTFFAGTMYATAKNDNAQKKGIEFFMDKENDPYMRFFAKNSIKLREKKSKRPTITLVKETTTEQTTESQTVSPVAETTTEQTTESQIVSPVAETTTEQTTESQTISPVAETTTEQTTENQTVSPVAETTTEQTSESQTVSPTIETTTENIELLIKQRLDEIKIGDAVTFNEGYFYGDTTIKSNGNPLELNEGAKKRGVTYGNFKDYVADIKAGNLRYIHVIVKLQDGTMKQINKEQLNEQEVSLLDIINVLPKDAECHILIEKGEIPYGWIDLKDIQELVKLEITKENAKENDIDDYAR